MPTAQAIAEAVKEQDATEEQARQATEEQTPRRVVH
jgi:hypothetical protein